MKVKLLEEWMGHPAGSVVDIIPTFAAMLIDRKQGEKATGEVKKPPVESSEKVIKGDNPPETEVSEEEVEKEDKQLADSKIHDTEYRKGKNKILKRRR